MTKVLTQVHQARRDDLPASSGRSFPVGLGEILPVGSGKIEARPHGRGGLEAVSMGRCTVANSEHVDGLAAGELPVHEQFHGHVAIGLDWCPGLEPLDSPVQIEQEFLARILRTDGR